MAKDLKQQAEEYLSSFENKSRLLRFTKYNMQYLLEDRPTSEKKRVDNIGFYILFWLEISVNRKEKKLFSLDPLRDMIAEIYEPEELLLDLLLYIKLEVANEPWASECSLLFQLLRVKIKQVCKEIEQSYKLPY